MGTSVSRVGYVEGDTLGKINRTEGVKLGWLAIVGEFDTGLLDGELVGSSVSTVGYKDGATVCPTNVGDVVGCTNRGDFVGPSTG